MAKSFMRQVITELADPYGARRNARERANYLATLEAERDDARAAVEMWRRRWFAIRDIVEERLGRELQPGEDLTETLRRMLAENEVPY